MKGLLLIVGVLGAGFALVAGVLFFTSGDADAGMSEEAAEVEVVSSTPENDYKLSEDDGFRVSYRYTVDQTTYAADEWLPEDIYNRGADVLICYNPDDPAEHVVPTRSNAECGDGNTGRADVQRAEESPAGAKQN